MLFQQLDLAADGLGRDVQVFARLHDAAQACHGPEVQQVLVVHFGFTDMFSSKNRIYAKH